MAGPSASIPTSKRWTVLLSILITAVAPCEIYPQQAESEAANVQPQAAFLFAYRAKAGQREAFEEGYRRHLDWHAEHDDPFVWYGWDVVTGSDVGVFVDGTFGPTPREFDNRVEPAADAADFATTAGPFADPLWRRVYRIRPELGTSSFLEDRRPSPFLRVLRYELKPGSRQRFEELLSDLAETQEDGPGTWSTYQLLDGGAGPGFLVLVPADGVAGVGEGGPVTWLEGLTRTQDLRLRVREVLSRTVDRAGSALWVLRRDLTLIPGGSG